MNMVPEEIASDLIESVMERAGEEYVDDFISNMSIAIENHVRQNMFRAQERAKVIFLDIDGVLNIFSDSYHTREIGTIGKAKNIEEHLVKRLMWIIKQTDAVIVISSSWRADMDELQKQLEEAGFTMWPRVIGKTPSRKHRGEEISEWLAHHRDVKSFVVLEDEIDDVCGDYCSIIPEKNVIEVDMTTGITHVVAQKAVDFLTGRSLDSYR